VVVDGEAKVALRGFPVSLLPADGLAIMPAAAKADEEGAFTLAGVTPARYDLNLPFAPAGTYVKSVTFNDRSVPDGALDCSAIAAGVLRIVLGTDGGKVEASVSSGDRPSPNATVLLLPADPARRFPHAVHRATSDTAGRAVLKDVPPGDYLAFAWENVEDDAWFDAEFVKAAQPDSAKVQVGPGGNQQVELKLIQAAR
jgi:hypothetical protein